MGEIQIKTMKYRYYIVGIVAICVFAGIIIYFLITKNTDMAKNNKNFNKVLIVGIDGMDPKMVRTMMDDGKMPHFKKLADSGIQTELQTVFPPQSPVAWTTIATGVNAGKHNIFDFIRRNPENYMPVLGLFETENAFNGTRYTSFITSEPFWKKLSDQNVNSTIIRWPMTFPTESFNGELLSGLGVPDIKGFLSGYTLYTEKDVKADKDSNKIEKIDLSNGTVDTVVYGPRTMQGSEIKDITAPIRIEKIDANSVRIINDEQIQEVIVGEWTDWMKTKFSINFFTKKSGIWRAYLESVEPFQMFVTTMQIDPEDPITEISYPHDYSSDLAHEIGEYYTLGMPEETDGLMDGVLSEDGFMKHIGQIESERDKMFWREFDKFQQRDNGVFAFVYDASDRLQHTHWREKILVEDVPDKIEYDAVIEEYYINKDNFIGEVLHKIDDDTAIIVLSDHGITSFERGLNVNTWLKDNGYMTLTQNITDEDDGSLFEYVNWTQTSAYAVGFNAIYINQKGREGQGIVENKEELVDEIIKKLEGIIDEKTGKKVIYKAYRASEIWHGDALDNAPDIILGYYPGYRTDWKTAIGGFAVDKITDNDKLWTGDHMVDKKFVPGTLFTNFKISKDIDIIEQVDIVPTIYDILNIEPSSDFDGQSIL